MIRIIITAFFTLVSSFVFSQTQVEGYAFESGNRGFLKGVNVTLIDFVTNDTQTAITDENGKYIFNIQTGHNYLLRLENDLFETIEIEIKREQISENDTVFLSHELKREPGYIFEITLAEKNAEPNAPKNQLKGALVEVFNNTKEEEVLIIDSLVLPDFKVDLKKGNHYTVLVRHPNFLSKRMEAFVDVEGCILCFEGIGDVRPGVSDNLTEGNTQGTLLANVELERYYDGKIISLSNIYYDLDDYRITTEAAKELDKVSIFINDNPNIEIELSSHTDSRGMSDYNHDLSQKRSESAVGYLFDKGGVNPNQMTAQGYGESQLINNCKEGVKCSEADHQVNRRTELRLLKIEQTSLLKSLTTLKREEKFEKMLNELEFGGSQVRVTSEDDLPLAKNSEANEQERAKGENIEEEGHDLVTEEINKNQEVKNTKSTLTKLVNSDIANYTGYKLVIHFSRFTLPVDHTIFSENENVLDFITKDNNHLYMVGDFQNRNDANFYLKEELLKKYSNAYLVGFENGIRVE